MTTSAASWRRVEAVIDAFLDGEPDLSALDEAGLRARVEPFCRGDEELVQDALELLLEMRVRGDTLDTPLNQLLPSLLGEIESERSAPPNENGAAASTTKTDRIGSSLDRYRLLSVLGRGGMGVVYLAERSDETFEKQVALKLLPWGLEGPEAIRRFRTERQILARLEHPGIARLLDGGVTEEGSPYLVMELVQGEAIDVYCDRAQLSVRRRVELFLDVCVAVGYAHRNLVVHRDLKPSNCLVSTEGKVKLLDFGIGKMLDQDAGSGLGTLLQPMTPRYASPEQLSNLPVSTASDVYSLGLLLYHLLTGEAPFDGDGQTPEQARRVVDEQEPVAPSMRLSARTSVDDTLDRQRRALQGDLDVIVLKALRHDPNERYGSAGEFHDDLVRWLEQRPVRARPVTRLTRVRKFVARNRLPVAASLLLCLVLLGGAVALLLQARSTERQRERAQTEADRSQSVVRLLTELLQASSADSAGAGERTARELFEQAEQNLRRQLVADPLVLGSMLEVMATSFTSFGDYEKAQALAEEAMGLIEGQASEAPVALAKVKATLANVRTSQGLHQGAAELLRESLRLLHEAGESRSVEAAGVHRTLASLTGRRGERDVSVSHARKAVELYEEAEEPVLAAYAKTSLASSGRAAGEVVESIELNQQALSVFEATFAADHPSLAGTRNNLGTAYLALGRYAEAEELYRVSHEASVSVFGAQHRRTAGSLTNLSRVLLLRGAVEEASEAAARAVAILQESLAPEHPSLLGARLNVASTRLAQGKVGEAVTLYREGLARFTALTGAESSTSHRVRSLLGTALIDAGRLDEAEDLLEEARAGQMSSESIDGHLARGETLLGLSHVRAARANCFDALQLLSEAGELLPDELPEQAPHNRRRQRIERLCPRNQAPQGM